MDNYTDRFGISYKLSELKIKFTNPANKSLATPIQPYFDCGYYRLFLESGCGFETDIARQTILKKVFTDISNFVSSPLTANGNKINILIKNFYATGAPIGAGALASSVFLTPNNGNNAAEILDNEIWKTIHLGFDSFNNTSSYNGPYPNIFYHGYLGISFNPTITYNTSLVNVSANGENDLYSIILHEATHLLGFESLIHNINNTYVRYFSRYDTFLKNSNDQFLINQTGCTFTVPTLLEPLVHPGCSIANTGAPLDITVCANAIKYVGINNPTSIPVYTPTCFEEGSSLSHFEDSCFPPNGNDLYFSMSNAALKGINSMKRWLKPEERSVFN